MNNIKISTLEAYQTSDGLLFAEESDAEKHQQDIIGELLDTLLPHDDRGNVTMADRHQLLIKMLESDQLQSVIKQLNNALN